MASLVGREFTSAQLNPIVEEMTEDWLFEILEEAIAARVIEELPRSVGQYQFTHALIHETLAGEMSTTKKVRLHARIAQVMEELYGDDTAAHAAELVHHFAEAEAVLGSDRLVYYSRIAGEKALAAYAFDDVVAHLGRALTAKEGGTGSHQDEPVTDEETAGIVMDLGYAQAGLNNIDQASSLFHRAFDYYASTGNVPKVVEIAEFGHSYTLIAGTRLLISRALELVEPDSHDAGRILATYGYLRGTEEGGVENGLGNAGAGASHKPAGERQST